MSIFSSAYRIVLFMILAAALLVISCGGPAGDAGSFEMPPTPVEIQTVTQGPVADTFQTVGSIEAEWAVTVASEIDGKVMEVPFREGEKLRKGEVIARLDDSQLKAELERAEALRAQSRVTFDRVKRISEQGIESPQALDDAAAALRVAEANEALAKTRLEKAVILAPFAGTAGTRKVNPGAFIRPGTAITDLAKIDELRVRFSVPERHLGEIERGKEVIVSSSAHPDLEHHGEVEIIEPLVDPGTRNGHIVARIDNPDGKLRPGMSADVSLILGSRESAVTISSEAVFAEGENFWVFLVEDDDTVTRRALRLGVRLPGTIEVLEGVSPGDRVVVGGHQKLFDGAKVTPVSLEAEDGAGR